MGFCNTMAISRLCDLNYSLRMEVMSFYFHTTCYFSPNFGPHSIVNTHMYRHTHPCIHTHSHIHAYTLTHAHIHLIYIKREPTLSNTLHLCCSQPKFRSSKKKHVYLIVKFGKTSFWGLTKHSVH